MKKGSKGYAITFFALALLLATPFAFAGFSDWWASFTGKASTDTATVSITLTGSAPTICGINISGATFIPIETSTREVVALVTVCDADGYGNIDTSSVAMQLHLSGETNRTDSSCALDTANTNSTASTFECVMTMQYYDDASGSWEAHAQGSDTSANEAEGAVTFTYQELNAMTITDTSVSFPSISTTSTNVQSTADPTLNNRGNADLSMNVTAYDLDADSNSQYAIGANNFSIDDDSNGCSGSGGTILSNATATLIASGPHLTPASGASQDFDVCVNSVNSNLIDDTYTGVEAWEFGTIAV